MQRRSSTLWFLLPIIAVLGVHCSSSSDGEPVVMGPDAAADAADAAAPTDAADAATDSGEVVCSALTLKGPNVPTMFVAGDPPAALGGVITPGIYYLTEHTIFNGTGTVGPTGQLIAKTAELTPSVYRFAEGKGSSASGITKEETISRDYVLSGTTMTMTSTCPEVGAIRIAPYSVVGNQVHIYTPNANTRQVLTRQ